MIEWSILHTGKCKRLDEVPEGAWISAINGREVLCKCEACHHPILDGQPYTWSEDGSYLHTRCRSLEKSTIERRSKSRTCIEPDKGIRVEAWISWEDADKYRRSTGDVCGGFFLSGMRWADYLAVRDEEEVPYLEAIRADVRKRGLRIYGKEHHKDWVPLFSDGTVGQFGTHRAWGDLMAAIWAEEENEDYAYWDFDVEDVGL